MEAVAEAHNVDGVMVDTPARGVHHCAATLKKDDRR